MKKRKPDGYWTLERCKKDALKYKSRTKWHKKSSGAYDKAIKNGWLNICCKHMVYIYIPKGVLNKKHCLSKALKCKNRKEMKQKFPSEYNAIRNNRWHIECFSHMVKIGNSHLRALYAFEHPDRSVYVGLTYNYNVRYNSHMSKNKLLMAKKAEGGQVFKTFNEWYSIDIVGKKEADLIEKYRKNGWTILNKAKAGGLGGNTLFWTNKKLIDSAKKCKNIRQWMENFPSAYTLASKRKLLDTCCAHMERRRIWTNKEIIKDASKYKTRVDWYNKSRGPCSTAQRRGIYELCCKHMVRLKIKDGTLTQEFCKEDALKYKTRSEWAKNSASAYKKAKIKGWSENCCSHMGKPVGGVFKKVKCVELNKIFISASEAARQLGLNVSKVCAVARGKAKKYKNFTFKYVA
jgi:hypothetical protein